MYQSIWEKIGNRLRKGKHAVAVLIGNFLDDISLRRKLLGMYLVCVLLPLVLTDSVVLSVVIRAERDSGMQEMKNTAEAVAYSLNSTVENAVNLTQTVYQNRYVNEFIEGEYDTPLDYYNAYMELMKDSLYEIVMGTGSFQTVIYADNPGFVNGGYFCRLELAREEEWYQRFVESGREVMVIPYTEREPAAYSSQKKLSVVRRMDYYHKGLSGDVLKLDLDYGAMIRSLANARYANTVYVCCENRILFSNDGRGGVNTAFEEMDGDRIREAGVHRSVQMYGYEWDIYVMQSPVTALQIIRQNLAMILFLLTVNVLLPLLFVRLLNRSFTLRLRALGEVFEKENGDHLQPLSEAKGKDEIGMLMRSYNHMAERMNELIQTVYKDRLKEQEMDIARQTAELLALHSQINPHFLFNALESIRMHSILKKEYETADMVEKLALMQRQNVEWSSDSVTVEEELRFARAYLELQKYRFGERLSYQMETEEECRTAHIPKLSLVTFVENACVHGIEKKTSPGWIFVRIYRRRDGSGREFLCMEVEDTGAGMPQEELFEMQDRMNHARIDQLREKGRVGILNACIRLKMATGDRAAFEMESEEGVGTIVTIRIPMEDCKEGEENAEGNAGG